MTSWNRFLAARAASKRQSFTQGCMGRGTSGAMRPMFPSPQLHYSLVFSKERSPARAHSRQAKDYFLDFHSAYIV